MLRQEFLNLLRCPQTQSRLRAADEALLATVNAAIAAGTVRNKLGQSVTEPLEAGLVCEDGSVLYPMLHEIPILLADEGIKLDQLSSAKAE